MKLTTEQWNAVLAAQMQCRACVVFYPELEGEDFVPPPISLSHTQVEFYYGVFVHEREGE